MPKLNDEEKEEVTTLCDECGTEIPVDEAEECPRGCGVTLCHLCTCSDCQND